MAAPIDHYLKVPYEIGCFIASQVPYLDLNDEGEPWALHEDQFSFGPNPFIHQMAQGILLQVVNSDKRPRALYTKYGEWMVFGPSSGSFDKVFEIVKNALNLQKIEELSDEKFSFFAVRRFEEKEIEEPILAEKPSFISYETAWAAYQEFKQSLIQKV